MWGVFAVLGGLVVLQHRSAARTVALSLGGALLLLGAAAPGLQTAPHGGWLAFMKVFDRVFSAVVLSSRDELRRRRPALASMWEPYPGRNRDPKHHEKIW